MIRYKLLRQPSYLHPRAGFTAVLSSNSSRVGARIDRSVESAASLLEGEPLCHQVRLMTPDPSMSPE